MHGRHSGAVLAFFREKRRDRYWLIGLLVSAVLLCAQLSELIYAQSPYPAFRDAYVNDYGEVLSPGEEASVRTQLEQFRTQTGVHAVLLTIRSIQDYSAGDSAIEPFATNVFNRWGIGDATRNDGILLLVAPGDRQVRLELGSGYSTKYDQVAQFIIDEYMLPQFKQGKISDGTISGITAIVQNFDPSQTPPAYSSRESYSPAGDREFPKDWVGYLLGIGGMGFAGGVSLWRQWWRYRQRHCPKCQTALKRLEEQVEDQYLTAGQRREESLRSVDYDIWLCHHCGYHTALAYARFGSRYQKCSKCRHRTMLVNSRTVVAPTYTSTGKAKITEDCKFCDHDRTYTRTLPRKERSSTTSHSSGRSSSGGGRSSGGGASGSW